MVAVVLALWVSHDPPDPPTYYLTTCGRVADWASNEDSACNQPLLDRAVIAVALLAIAALLVLEVLLARRVEAAASARSVLAVTIALAVALPSAALVWANVVSSGTTKPSLGVAVASLAGVVATVSLLRVASTKDRVARLAVAAIIVAGAAALAGYAVMLWGGNGT